MKRIKTTKQLIETRKKELAEIIKKIKEETERPCCAITLCENSTPEILDNKIGGQPYLPVGEEYPTDHNGNPLALLLQINCKDIVGAKGFPKNGILEIFVDKDLNYPSEYDVRYYQENQPYQTELPDVDMDYFVITRGYKIKTEETKAPMPVNDFRFIGILRAVAKEVAGIEINSLFELEDEFPNEIDVLDELYCNLEQPEIVVGGYADFTQEDFRQNLRSYIPTECLFKIDGGANKRIHIGDAGILSVVITKKNLIAKRFDSAFLEWDCL